MARLRGQPGPLVPYFALQRLTWALEGRARIDPPGHVVRLWRLYVGRREQRAVDEHLATLLGATARPRDDLDDLPAMLVGWAPRLAAVEADTAKGKR